MHTYGFRTLWRVRASWQVVYDVLADVGAYPRWWPQVRAVHRIDDTTADVVCRSALPFRLCFRAAAARQEREAGVLEAALTGDLDGWCRWTVTPDGAGSVLTFEQRVEARTTVLRWTAPVARPVFRLNHAWMMRGGRRGLARYLETRT